MKRNRVFEFLIVAALGLLIAGCSSKSEIDKAIADLDGDERQVEEAMGKISISTSDPTSKLVKALGNRDLSSGHYLKVPEGAYHRRRGTLRDSIRINGMRCSGV